MSQTVQDEIITTRSQVHLLRRFWHVLWGVVGYLFYYYTQLGSHFWAWICAIIALIGFSLDIYRSKNEKINAIFTKLVGPILRKSERYSFSGLPFYALGVSLSLFFYSDKIAILAISFLIFADPVASIVGVYFGKDKLLPNKTLQGTIAAFITCFIIATIYSYIYTTNPNSIIVFAFLSSIVGAISEMLGAFNIDDNLLIPIVSGGMMTLLNYSFCVF